MREVYDRVLDCAPSERDSLLDEECRGDAELRAEVLSLLEAEVPREFLAPDPRRRILPRDVGPEIPAEIGPYVIDAELGRGGMGVVYLAEDRRLGRRVALKALAPECTGDEARRERLQLEARAAAALSHPGIATVYTLEEFDGRLCMVSEYVEGETLRSTIQSGALPTRTLVDYGQQICRALGAAHAAGIVHRDLKPENVIVSPAGTVKVLDFGIARLSGPVIGPGRRLTETGTLVGTPGYMSPEQLEGRDADARSDIFSLGVLLYEMATGDHPFEGTTTFATALRVLKHEPPGITAVNPLVHPDLDRVVRRCLQKAPKNRYQSAAEVIDALENVGRGVAQTLAAAPPATGPASSAPLSYRAVWRVHQYSVMAVYGALVYPLWIACKASEIRWMKGVFFVALGTAVLNGTLRVHLLFTEHFNLPAMAGQIRSALPWVRRSDLVYAACLVAGALPIAEGHIELACLLGAVGMGAAAIALIVEPSTLRAAFGRRVSTAGGRTPPGKDRP